MRILMSCPHQYPANGGLGTGLQPKKFPSCSGQHLHDLMVKGLAERGHEVFYHLPNGYNEPLPEGVQWLSKPTLDIDVYHSYAGAFDEVYQLMAKVNKPFIKTCHIDRASFGCSREEATREWIFVSKTLANLYSSERYIHCGLDPADFIYSETKDDYFLMIGSMERHEQKGLKTALDLSHKRDFKLVVAGTAKTAKTVSKVKALCDAYQAEYVGDVRGEAKAALYAGAKAVLFPTRQAESFGLVIAEAMFSGTPIICSDLGAIPEVMTPKAGFVCTNEADYLYAIDHIDEILPKDCRAKAMKDYHYETMVDNYLKEYEKEISRSFKFSEA